MYQGEPTGLLMGMTTTTSQMKPSERYARLTEQRAYERRIAAFGILAALAPYRPAQVAR